MADGSGKPNIVQFGRERDRKSNQRFPIIYIFHADGTKTSFRRRAIAVQDQSNDPDSEVYAVLVNREGEQFCDPHGNPVVLNVPVVLLGVAEAPDAPLTWKDVAERAGVSLSSVKRAVGDGHLPKPHKAGKRAVRFASADVRAWVDRVRRHGK